MRLSGGWISGLVGVGLALSGCSTSRDVALDGAPSADDLRGRVAAKLRAADSCDDLLGRIQADAIVKLDLAIELYKEGLAAGGVDGVNRGGPVPVPVDDVAVEEPVPPGLPAGGSDAGASDGDFGGGVGSSPGGGQSEPESGGDGPTGASGTNVQVKDVDEADYVKVVDDGARLYLLHGGQLFALDTWPPSEMSLYGEPATIEGYPHEMFVHQGKALVFSAVEDYGGRFDPKEDEAFDERYGYGRSFTKLTVLDVSGPTPSVLRELYYEGHYTSARRHDRIARVVLQAQSRFSGLFYPDIEPRDPWGRPYSDAVIDAQLQEWRERTAAAIRGTQLSDWLPAAYERVDGTVRALPPACENFYTPVPGLTDWGMTRIVGVDLQAPDANVLGTTILGAASIVYANLDTMLLAQPDYRALRADQSLFVSAEQTALHAFSLSGAETRYRASGWVPGHPLNQFALAAREDGVLVSTTGWRRVNPDAEPFEERWWPTEPVNQVLAVREQDGELKVASSTGPIGHEGESITATRFLGDKAYVVTFERTDPLIVVDTSDLGALKALGEVEIPGFSTYVHPLGDQHLLTIGESGQWGVQLQIFDVSDPLKPTRTHVHDYGSGSNSEAQWNHKAFNFYAKHGLLGVPVTSWQDRYRSGLDVLRVSVTDGFTPLGMSDHSEFTQQHCETWWDEQGEPHQECWPVRQSEVRRGVFVEGGEDVFLYSIGWGGVLAHNVADMATVLASVPLPAPVYEDGGYGGGVDVAPQPGDPEPEPGWADAGVPDADPPPPAADGGVPMDPDAGV